MPPVGTTESPALGISASIGGDGGAGNSSNGAGEPSTTKSSRRSTGSSSKRSLVIPDLTRLPKTTVPKRYELKLDVEPEKKTFSGKVNIR